MSLLRRDGYLEWPDAVPRSRIERARHLIHRDLRQYGLHPDRFVEYENGSFCPALRRHPEILSLFVDTDLAREAERRLGPLEPVDYAQIALRFPRDESGLSAHLDGVAAPGNKVAPNTIRTFTALAGVYLSDVDAGGGAFTVWPGSHLRNAAHFRENGSEALLEGVPPVGDIAPEAIVGRAGHGFLAHYLLTHAVGHHAGPDIRYAVFFRLRAVGHDRLGRRTMTEPWREWRDEG